GRLGVPNLFIAVNVVLGLGVATAVAWRRPSRVWISAAAILLALLTGPITWPGYTILLLPVLFAVGWRRALPAVVLLAFPYWEVIRLVAAANSGTAQFFVGSVYFLGLVALAVILAWSRRSSIRPPWSTWGAAKG
ncbi:MAG TPA: hypothetical protein VFY90_09965, partial [Tepidiformaceae bacterium]|nr:hypothetical protein [Tepidiformaceae bacterium]